MPPVVRSSGVLTRVQEWVEAAKNEMFTVWSKPSTASHINIVKCIAIFKGVNPEVLYDTLHDAEYRAVWDENMIEVRLRAPPAPERARARLTRCPQGKIIQQLDPQNEVGYYSAKVRTLSQPSHPRGGCMCRHSCSIIARSHDRGRPPLPSPTETL